MRKFISSILILILLLLSMSITGCQKKPQKFTDYSFDFFDTVTTIVGFEESEENFNTNCEKIKGWLLEYHKLYDIYTYYDGVTNLCSINNSNGETNAVDKKIIDLLSLCKDFYRLTDGKLNVAMGSVLSVWHDCREYGINNPEKAELPSETLLSEASKHTDINRLVINSEKQTVTLTDSNLTLDVGAIAKGYAVEQVAQKMKTENITGYILNVGGNVKIVGERKDGQEWKVGIENPISSDSNPYIEQLSLKNMSLVTSGSYQRFYTVKGKNYHHIIDPDTLMPADYFLSVSVLCEDSALADALSTTLFCMNFEDGIKLIEKFENTEALWVLKDGTKKYSKGFEAYIGN